MKYEMKCYAGNESRINITQEFIERNQLAINAQVAKDMLIRESSFLGCECEIAVNFLPFEEGKDKFKKEYIQRVEDGEIKHTYISDVSEGTQDFLDYMVFAWMKAMDERGLSALRSIIKLATWIEILGRKDVADILNDDKLYNPYGRPALREACKKLGINYPDYL